MPRRGGGTNYGYGYGYGYYTSAQANRPRINEAGTQTITAGPSRLAALTGSTEEEQFRQAAH